MGLFKTHRRFAFVAIVLVALLAAGLLAIPALSGAGTLKLPKGVKKADAYRMYGEQLDSQSAIGQLVDGEMASLTVTDRSVTATSAELKLAVRYANGLKRTGVMRLFKAGGVWYLATITRGTRPEPVEPPAKVDNGVLNTILAEQVENTALTEQIVNGTYKEITLEGPRVGYRSVEVPVTLGGAKGRAKVAGRITCIRKLHDGERVWFVTGFAQ